MPRIRLLLPALLAALALTAGASAAPRTIDGPSAAVAELGNLAVAPDGTGGIAYLKTVGAVKRVFVATLANGAWSAPAQIAVAGNDAKDALQPRIAAGNGGRLALTFKIDEGGGAQPNDQ